MRKKIKLNKKRKKKKKKKKKKYIVLVENFIKVIGSLVIVKINIAQEKDGIIQHILMN